MSQDETARKTAAPKSFPWELWSQVAVMMAGIALLGWVLVFMRLGIVSVYIHSFILSTLGILTLPVIFWGLTKTIFNQPIFRWPRTIAYLLLVLIALFCNVPMFAVPLSTEDWESTHDYRLPVEGEWVTTAGGDSKKTNYHATTATYRWGYDFTRVEDGKRFKNEGKELSDYYCFGEPVFSAVEGKVVKLERKHEDNAPNVVTDEGPLGNYVVIKVDEAEYLYIAQLKKRSIPVKVGDTVAPGDKVGECGNSGRAMLPHVHIHLQNTGDFPVAESLPLRFSNYLADGEAVEKGMPQGPSDKDPLLGQRVENQ
ncbi:M23 family metallopeptidase [Bradymonas sediminis]|uniref:M23ase beta-sheet core domain-containing protein n=1 Tax=Bradymonas sediminis TaxID=1548548 RepID=A0A2Z4FMQ1_9DELT|nr:M23 family metallopeptidase [Bradymonas sediminis]AWV90202.1 hypothetical protein DN745_13005 [Bradymonas sediminis]TDP75830.1 murein DD-endopeptidase MepM/ murein hydrolase activator NlpD [Bradymonas sediminis]